MNPFPLIVLAAIIFLFGAFAWSSRAQAQSRDDIRNALKKIETTAPPEAKMGAMCYKTVMPPEYQEYVCPRDGEKTTFSRESAAYAQVNSLAETKRLIAMLVPLAKDVRFSLDERGLCAACTPGLDDGQRSASLIVRYPDGRTVSTAKVTPDDIRYLIGFFKDGLTYESNNEGIYPLKDKEPRLKELLGEKERSL
jgi:hypothetical protein